ncbi:MAG: thioredoxin domain-containing protein [bacterium]|nr:thioredoxin domain-containing protein [bacterium]
MATFVLSALLLAGVGNSDVTLLFFTADWCQPCAQMQPNLQQLYGEGWDVQRIDVDQHPELAQKFQIQNLPTVVILASDQEVDRVVGVASYAELAKRSTRAAARSGASRLATNSPTPTAHPQTPGTQQQGTQPIVRGQSPGVAATASAVVSSAAATRPRTPSFPKTEAATLVSPSVSPAAAGSAPAMTLEQAMAKAAAATVRIRVDEGQTTAHGTGTIIDVHGQEALVLTCGHLFRDMQPGSQLSVDLFAGTPQEVNLAAALIDHKADEEDIGLISFKLPVAVEPVQLLPRGEPLRIGQRAFSYGCDHGQDPTRRDTHITNINRYVGAANVEIAGAPAVGRSGGGLFDVQGRLIGVCNAADANDDEGIYAAADVIYDQIERLGMTHLFQPDSTAAAPVQFASQATQVNPTTPADPLQWPDEDLQDSGNPVVPALANSGAAQTEQVICIFRDKSGQSRMLTIDTPSQELIRTIEGAVVAQQ